MNKTFECPDNLTTGCELAIKELGYKIIDSEWKDEEGVTTYTVAPDDTHCGRKKDIIIHKNKKWGDKIHIPNIDVEDINTLYSVLKKYKVSIGLKQDE